MRREEGRREKGTGDGHVRLRIDQYVLMHSGRIVRVRALAGATFLCFLSLSKLHNSHSTSYHQILRRCFVHNVKLACSTFTTDPPYSDNKT